MCGISGINAITESGWTDTVMQQLNEQRFFQLTTNKFLQQNLGCVCGVYGWF